PRVSGRSEQRRCTQPAAQPPDRARRHRRPHRAGAGRGVRAVRPPTLQRALDELLAAPGRTHERIGLAGPNKRFMHNTYSDLLSSPHVTEGAVDWVNVHLAAGEVLACVQSGLFLIRDEDGSPYAVFVSGARDDRPDSNLRVEVSALDTHSAEVVLGQLRD